MSFFARFAPGRAYRDLRLFLGQRQPHQLWFLFAAVALTGVMIALFARNDYPTYYKPPEITYVRNYNPDRSAAQIRAEQLVDEAAKEKRQAEIKQAEDERRAQFKKVDDAMKRWGI